MTTINTFAQAISAQLALREQVRNHNVDKAGAEPTIDRNGRLHAPFDGYVWEDITYMGGEYLGENTDTNVVTLKIKILANLKEAMQQFFDGSCGKTWTTNAGETCFFYANLPQWQASIIEQLIPKSGRRIVLVQEGETPETKVWKFSYAKSCATIKHQEWGAYNFEYNQKALNTVPVIHEPGRKVRGKLQEYYSEFDGKTVRYEYFDDIIKS